MQTQHTVLLPDQLYHRLQALANLKGQSVDALVQATLEDAILEEENDELDPTEEYLQSLPSLDDFDALLPPYGSPEEEELRRQLAEALSGGASISQMIIDDRGER